MSLVGSLEDLGLGDILQIVSLSRKSGVLLLRSDSRRGRIVLLDGQVRGGCVEGVASSLREILVDGGFVPEDQFKLAADAAEVGGIGLQQAVAEHTGLARERIESLLREQVEHAVLTMLGWRVGEFSFEVRAEVEPSDAELLLPAGINAQYLAMEATRLGDEGDAPRAPEPEAPADAPMFSGEELGPSEVPVATAAGPEHTEVPVETETASEAGEAPLVDAELLGAGPESEVSLVAIDPELAALEWLKSTLDGCFSRIHIFQDAEAGVGRVRQYLARGARPVVLLGAGSGARASSPATALVRRLQGLAPGMPILLLGEQLGERDAPAGTSGVVPRPPSHQLASRRTWPKLEEAGRQLREILSPWRSRAAAASSVGTGAGASVSRETPPLERLRVVSQRLRDPATRGDVVSLVLDFAAESLSRVAMFMVRDGMAVGMVQRGLARAGGPGDELLREISVPVGKPACFRRVMETRSALRVEPNEPSDRRITELLGDVLPAEVYVAPIESGGEVAALLYADQLPDRRPVGDTTPLEIVLHEAGLALDRALLERALAELEGTGNEPDAEL